MSTPDEKETIVDEEINESSDDGDYLSNDEEGEIRELVCALPTLTLYESINMDETIRNEAAIAANLIVTAAEEAEEKTNQTLNISGSSFGSPKSKKGSRPHVLLEAIAGASGSSVIGSTEDKDPIKKAKRRVSTQLTNPPQGPPTCNVCGKIFGSWRAVFGHLKQHKDRGYQGFYPPPTFNVVEDGSSGTVAASSDGGGFGLGTEGLGIDLNASPVEEEGGSEADFTTKFDLNKSPPKDDEEEKDKAK